MSDAGDRGGARAAGGRSAGTSRTTYPEPVAAALRRHGRPFIDRADLEGESLGRFAADLAAACGLAAKARILDPEGGLADELARLLGAGRGARGRGRRARAPGCATSSARSTSSAPAGRPAGDADQPPDGSIRPRAWSGRSSSRSASGARSGKEPTRPADRVASGEGVPGSCSTTKAWTPTPASSRSARALRELVRLLYVTLTRRAGPRWSSRGPGLSSKKNSFAWLWGAWILRASTPSPERRGETPGRSAQAGRREAACRGAARAPGDDAARRALPEAHPSPPARRRARPGAGGPP